MHNRFELVRFDRTTIKKTQEKLMYKLWTGWKIFGTSLLEHLVLEFGTKASKLSALRALSKTLKKQGRKYLPECGLSARNSKLFSRDAVLTLSILQLA
jgi:hypothetical protein